MVSSIYKKTFSVLMKRPFRLWGISLLAEFLCLVAYAGFIGVPAAAFCAALLLSASMSMIFLNSYRTGLEPKTTYLFASFKKGPDPSRSGRHGVDAALDLPVVAHSDRRDRVRHHPFL